MQLPFDQILKILIRELLSHKTKVVLVFCIISILFLGVGLVWPKKYVSFATIVSDNQNIIQPLLAGAAVPTKVSDKLRISKEILFSQKIMHKLLMKTGFITVNTDPITEELISETVKKNTRITKVGRTLIKITYQGDNPRKVYNVTKTFVELFVEEGEEVQARESKDAFMFIEKQLKEYHGKLIDAEDKLKNLRTKNYDARPGTEMVVNEAIAGYRRKINAARLELQEALIKRKSLEDQLSGEAEITTLATRDGQFRTRILNLQSQLDTMRLSYHEEHPDIVRTKRQIEDIKKTIIQEDQTKQEAKNEAEQKGAMYVDEGVLLSPLYQQLRSDLSLTKTNVLTLRTRISATKKLMQEEFERLKRISETEATLAELTRDYEVNRDMYTSLQTRREKANISMNLGNESTGPSFRIQEPARLPLVPSGLRFLHFLIAGIFLGVSIPIGSIYAYIYFDPRIRTSSLIEAKLNIPVIAVIPHISDDAELNTSNLTNKYLYSVVSLIGALYITIATLKILKVL
ncbi:hypothetical protein MNBD_GAMMA22-3 [hydrothermal vent metagenome]|uniref:Polysaccharide chain length determinant N-terminal domain-containing protein n=1 Tax=hydrothermal vent metagenome TaxID=652676 RepID=A0A3B1A0X6_9ZZZZ